MQITLLSAFALQALAVCCKDMVFNSAAFGRDMCFDGTPTTSWGGYCGQKGCNIFGCHCGFPGDGGDPCKRFSTMESCIGNCTEHWGEEWRVWCTDNCREAQSQQDEKTPPK